ncbi:DNA-binding response regulator, AraC family [Geofilum rubicundum JCM 15548]|uniref:histidine kinase n=2 Tax=Geofilum TaxID=1236988 RepID=A0A0E9LSP1_9BACT|nr:DNA-binding response regulator, AraC family [Geofilum rubicundum JCM 15548]
MIQRSAHRLQHIINELLDFKKIEAGKAELHLTKNNLADHLSKILEAFRMQAANRKISFAFETAEKSLIAQYDYDKLETVIYNLLSNALKYTRDGGRISLSLMRTNSLDPHSGILIRVSDTGIGIPKDQQEKIFEMFYHQKDAQPAEGKSSGIGLALTHELVHMHGGKVTVESEEGKGSCFIVYLPQEYPNGELPAIQPPASTPLDTPSTETDSPSERPLILVIDDHADVRTYLAEALSATYQVKMAADGHEGLLKAIELLPDLIISDVMMPGMDGMELCQRLKSDISTSHIPIILLTARQENSDAVEGYDRGTDAYMVKPFSLEVIQSQIRSLLINRTRLKEIFSRDSGLNLLNITNNVTDQAFIDKVVKTLDTHLDQTDFTSETLAEELQMSRTLLYKKIKALTGVTVHAFMLKVRMQKAAELLLSGDYNVSQVAYMVGFSVPGNFSRSFQKFYGLSPSKYLQERRNE